MVVTFNTENTGRTLYKGYNIYLTIAEYPCFVGRVESRVEIEYIEVSILN